MDLASSSVEFDPRLFSLAECLRLSAEPVFGFGSCLCASRRFLRAAAGEELATIVEPVGEPVIPVPTVPGLLEHSSGVDVRLLSVEVELGARPRPLPIPELLDLVLNAGGED